MYRYICMIYIYIHIFIYLIFIYMATSVQFDDSTECPEDFGSLQ